MNENENLVPKRRFKEFKNTGTWEQRKFSNIVNRVSQQSNDSNLPKVEFEDIISGEGRLNKDISSKFDSRKGTVFEPEFILYGKLRPYLKNWLFPNFRGIALGDFWVFEPNNSSSIFDYYLIQSDKYQTVANLSSGTKMPRSDWKTVSETEFSIPVNIEEQAKIGTFLKQLDDTIALHQRRLDKTKSLKSAYLSEMFPAKDERKPKRRFAEFTDDWEQRKLSELINDIADGPFGSNLKAVHYTERKEARIIQLSNISESGWQDKNVRYTTFKHTKEIKRSIVEQGELVMAKMMPAGLTIIRPNTDKMYVLSSDAVRIKLDNAQIDPKYFVCMTKSDYFLDQINNDAQGSTRTRTSISKIRRMDIPVPSFLEQQQIGQYFTTLDNLINLHQQKLEKLLDIKKAYLNEMFI